MCIYIYAGMKISLLSMMTVFRLFRLARWVKIAIIFSSKL